MKILIFGSSGQVGSALVARLEANHDVVALDKDELDITKLGEIEARILAEKPDWVINAAAYTAVDKAEDAKKLVYLLNALAPEKMAKACALIDAGFVHYSTDYVFDGVQSVPYKENDNKAPRSVYGVTKLEGEALVMAAQPNSFIFRTAWVYSKDGANFVNTMLRLAEMNDTLNIVNDQWGSPTLADDLAKVTIDVVLKTSRSELPHKAGIYHATGQGFTNWADFAERIFALAGCSVEVKQVPSSEYPTLAPRPSYSVLNNDKLKQTFELELPHWERSLERTLA